MKDRALGAMPGAFYVTDAQLHVRWANERFAALVGYGSGQLCGRALAEVLPDPLVVPTLEHERQVRAVGMPITREVEVARRHGATRTWLVTKYALGDDADTLEVGTLVVDVTEQVRGRAAAQREAAFMRQVLDMVPNLIYTKDRSGRFTLANQAMAELLGTTPHELLGCTEPELTHARRAPGTAVRDDRQVLEGGAEVVTPEEPRRDAQGARRWFRTTRHPLRVADGSAEQVLGVATDITEYRNAQRARLRLKEERMEAVGRLAGGIAHDFNNLLTVLQSGAQSLRQIHGGDEELSVIVNDIAFASERATRLTQHLLAYSRRQLLAPQHIDLNVAITEAASVLRRLLGAQGQLRLELARPLPAVLVDRASLEQILVNFASNARDAMPAGGALHLRTRALAGRLPGAQREGIVELVAEDTGEGIPPEVIDHIFEPFFTTKPEGEGTGLGLSTVYGIVRQSGGTIEAKNTPGRGARFAIRLPAAVGEAQPRVHSPAVVGEGRGETILVVDDEAAIRRVVRRILDRRGYRVLLADGLSRAQELAEHHRDQVALMLVDIVMPGANGFEVVRSLRPLLPAVPVLHMTGHTKDTLPLAEGNLEEAYLQKPFTRDQLLYRVRTALDERSVRA